MPHHVSCTSPAARRTSGWRTVEALAEQMVGAGGDRSSIVIAFGGGIVNDLGGFLASHLHARHSGDPGAHHAARAGGRGRRRQDRRQPRLRQEPDRRVPPAARRADRSRRARHAARARVPRRAVRSRQVRHHPQPASVRAAGARVRRGARPTARCRRRHDRRIACASRPRWSRPTSAKATCAAFSISATPSATRSKPRPATRASCTAKRSPSACSAATLPGASRPGILSRRRSRRRSCDVHRPATGPIPPLDGIRAGKPARAAWCTTRRPSRARSTSCCRSASATSRWSPASPTRWSCDAIRAALRMTAGAPRPPGATSEQRGRALGPRHVRPRRPPLRPAQPPAVVQHRPLLARPHRATACAPSWTRPGARVLDLCCGTGDLMLALAGARGRGLCSAATSAIPC